MTGKNHILRRGSRRVPQADPQLSCFAAVPRGDTAHAVCIPLHRGRTTIVLQTRITRGDGKLCALVMQTQAVLHAKK